MKLNWNEWFNIAKLYYEYHKNLLVPPNFKTKNGYEYDEYGYNLGQWIKNQRLAYINLVNIDKGKVNSAGTLTQERFQLLNSINMIYNIHDYRWNEMYELAKKYYKNHKNLLIDKNFKTKNGYEYDEKGYALGQWIDYQKSSYNQNRISNERIQLLNEIGMIFSIYESNWDEMYELAKNYYKHHGHLLIPHNYKTKNGYEYDKNGHNLGQWIDTQRIAFSNIGISKENRKNNFKPLAESKIKKLNKIGMSFKPAQDKWDRKFKLAKEYYKYHGHLLIDKNFKTKNGYEYDETGCDLGSWIFNQRKAYSNIGVEKGKYKNNLRPLTGNQVLKLESIDMVFNLKENKEKSKELCELFDLDYNKYKFLIKNISYKELNAKINYLIDNKESIMFNEEPHEIFFMSDINMQTIYGISKQEIIKQYYKSKNDKVMKKCF